MCGPYGMVDTVWLISYEVYTISISNNQPWLGFALLQVQPLQPYVERLLLGEVDAVEQPLIVLLVEYGELKKN